MTQYIEPNAKSDLKGDIVLTWLKSLRSGVLSGFEVSKYATGSFNINIASGWLATKGSTIHDDLTRTNDPMLALSAPAANTHAVIYALYTYDGNFPPGAMTFGCVKTTGTPPAIPSLPAGAVKLADIFVPSGATDLDTSKIINAPTLPARGEADTDILIDRLVNSNLNVMFTGGGDLTMVGDTFAWSEDIRLIAPVSTQQEKFFTAPLAVGTLTADDISDVGDNSILFTIFNRATVGDFGTPQTLVMHVLDLDTPSLAEMNYFFDPATREQIVWIALTIEGDIIRRSGMGFGLPAPDVDPNVFLRNVPSSAPVWSAITEDLIVSILSIASFGATTAAVEVGTTVTNPPFAAAYNLGPPTAASLLKDTLGTPVSQTLTPPAGSFTATGGWTKNNTNEYVRFQLTADAGHTPDTALADIAWQRFFYYGKGTSVAADEAGIKSLDDAAPGGRALAAGKAHTFVMTGLSSEYAYFAYPTSAGALVGLRDNTAGFDIDFVLVGTATAVATENGSGTTTDYYLYRTTYLQTGTVNLTTR